jgi:hypothetical protein
MNKKQLTTQFPEIKDMADQVGEGRAIFVSKFHINGEWKNSGFLPTTDLDRFYKSVLNLKGRLSDGVGIRICLAADKPSSKVKEVEVWFNNPENKEAGLGNVLSEGIAKQFEDLKKTVEEKSEASPLHTIQMDILKMQFNAEKETLVIRHKNEIEKRDTLIEELQEEVGELEEELKTAEKLMSTANNQLNGLEVEKENKNENFTSMLGNVGARILENFVAANPAILTKGFGVPEETVKEIFAASKVNKINNTAGTTEEKVPDPTDEFTGVDEKQVACILTLKNQLKTMPLAEFNVFWNYILLTFDENGKFHAAKATEILTEITTEGA